jgi:hypothetical protein
MDATIAYDEVAALVGVNIPTLEPRPNFERIRMLRRHLERALQRLAMVKVRLLDVSLYDKGPRKGNVCRDVAFHEENA